MDLIFYNGDHSVTFGTKNSWTDWHLIPASKPNIVPPSVKVKSLDIPGTNGSIDLSTVLTGYPTYNNRTGSLEFILAPGFESWENAKTTISEYLHGQTMNLYLADDPEYYYTGIFYVNSFRSDARTNGITINYDLYPFKHSILSSDDDWLWDPFNFETGVIRSWHDVVVDGSLELVIEDCPEPAPVHISSSSDMTLVHTFVSYNGVQKTKEYAITAGQDNAIGPSLKPGRNVLTFTGDGTISVKFRSGRL